MVRRVLRDPGQTCLACPVPADWCGVGHTTTVTSPTDNIILILSTIYYHKKTYIYIYNYYDSYSYGTIQFISDILYTTNLYDNRYN